MKKRRKINKKGIKNTKRKGKSFENVYKFSTWILTFISVVLTCYNLKLQIQAEKSKKILIQIEKVLNNLSTNPSLTETKQALNDIKSNILKSQISYIKSLGSMADTMEIYSKKLQEYENRIIKLILPNKPIIKEIHKGAYILKKETVLFDILKSKKIINLSQEYPTYVLVKLNISFKDVHYFEIQLIKNRHLIACYNYLPQGVYNKLEIPAMELSDVTNLIAYIGIYLKKDSLKSIPIYYCKEVKIRFSNHLQVDKDLLEKQKMEQDNKDSLNVPKAQQNQKYGRPFKDKINWKEVKPNTVTSLPRRWYETPLPQEVRVYFALTRQSKGKYWFSIKFYLKNGKVIKFTRNIDLYQFEKNSTIYNNIVEISLKEINPGNYKYFLEISSQDTAFVNEEEILVKKSEWVAINCIIDHSGRKLFVDTARDLNIDECIDWITSLIDKHSKKHSVFKFWNLWF